MRALLSVSNKTGIEDFARSLVKLGFEIVSTGGTKKTLENAGITVTAVEDITGFGECFSGRVKTLHPGILGGLLFDRSNPEHVMQAEERKIEPIDLIAVTLYPFEEVSRKDGVSYEELIEEIDIGGVTLLRAAAKNAEHVTVVSDSEDYAAVLEALSDQAKLGPLRKTLASKAFRHTAAYDSLIASTLSRDESETITLINKRPLRYGENPHQSGAYFDIQGQERSWNIVQEGEKGLSYLNILDADGAWSLVSSFQDPASVMVKHANPSGVAVHSDITEAFQRSYDADRLSAFGVIIALNRPCTGEIMQKIIDQKIFAEVLVAPGFDDEAVSLLKKRPKLRALLMGQPKTKNQQTINQYRSSLGGLLVQDDTLPLVIADDLVCVTETKPTDDQIRDLLFAWTVVCGTKSNAIVFAKDQTTLGIGAGQTSRVDATKIAGWRAGDKAQGACMASDAFFPFPDSLEEAAQYGISCVIQPGGSIRDEEVIAKANELGMSMVVTGKRGFRH